MRTRTAAIKDPSSPANVLAAMANPKRLQILCLLSEAEIQVGTLAEQVGLSQSALSQHLHRLREAELVETRRDAQRVYYHTRSNAVLRVLDVLECIYGDAAMHRYRHPCEQGCGADARDEGAAKRLNVPQQVPSVK